MEDELRQASDFGDYGKAESLEDDREFLLNEIKTATGLGGRSRKTPSGQERARTNIQTSISNTIKRAAKSDSELGRHLKSAIKTGSLCSYQPEIEIAWQL